MIIFLISGKLCFHGKDTTMPYIVILNNFNHFQHLFGLKILQYTEAPFLDLHLSISNGFVSSKIYDKRDDFVFDIVNFPFLDGDVPRSTSYGVYLTSLQLVLCRVAAVKRLPVHQP